MIWRCEDFVRAINPLSFFLGDVSKLFTEVRHLVGVILFNQIQIGCSNFLFACASRYLKHLIRIESPSGGGLI